MHHPQTGERHGDTRWDRIRLSGISATGHHGVFEHERRDGQTFVADVVLHVDTRGAAAEDRLDLTVDYGVLADQVAGVLTGEPADLLETVAERIAAVALSHPQVAGVDVVLHKPQAPIQVPFGDVTVEISRDRDHPPVLSAPPVVVGSLDGEPEQVAVADLPTAHATPGAHAAPGPLAPLPVEPAPLPQDDADLGRPMALSELLAPSLAAGALPSAAAIAGAGAAAAGTATLPVVPAEQPGAAPEGAAGLGTGVGTAVGTDVPVGQGLPATDAAPSAAPSSGSSTPSGTPSIAEPRDRFDVVPEQPVEVVLALGSNMGASHDTLRTAIWELDALDGFEVDAISPLARSAAVGGPEQADYLNAVVLGRSTLSPRALLLACQAIEAQHGRERLEHWGPRTLDIDLVLHGSTVGVADDLELPHPRAHQRAFVLQPWAQVAPDAVLPGLGGGPVADLARTAPDREGIRWMALDWWKQPEAGA